MKPIFIIGNPRSGTTLLRLMLTCHHNIEIPPEGGFMISLYDKYSKRTDFSSSVLNEFLDDFFIEPKQETWKLDHKGLHDYLIENNAKSYSELVDAVYRYYIQTRAKGKNRWGDKNNYYLNHIEQINSIFPDAVFLHIVRDGRDIVCSYRDMAQINGRYSPKLPSSLFGAAYNWLKNLQIIQRSFDKMPKDRALTIRYEDLIRNPQGTLKIICDFLEEDYDHNMLNFAQENRERKLVPDAYMGWKERTKSSLTDERIGRWKREMSYEDRVLFRFMAGKMLEKYSYEIEEKAGTSLSSLQLRLRTIIWISTQKFRGLISKSKRLMSQFSQ